MMKIENEKIMTNEHVTTDLIIETMKGWVEERHQIPPHQWLEVASKLNTLIGDDHDVLFDLEQQVAQMKVRHIESGDTVAAAKVRVESTDTFRQTRRQKAKIAQIEEFIRIAKLTSRLKDNEWGQ